MITAPGAGEGVGQGWSSRTKPPPRGLDFVLGTDENRKGFKNLKDSVKFGFKQDYLSSLLAVLAFSPPQSLSFIHTPVRCDCRRWVSGIERKGDEGE